MDKSSMHADYPNSTVPCMPFFGTHPFSESYTLDGAVGDTYLPSAQPKLVPNVVLPTWLGEEGYNTSLQEGPVGESYSFGNSVQYTSEPNRIVQPSATYTPNSATREAGVGLVGVCSSSGPMIITKTIKSSTNLAKAHSLRHSQVLLSQSKPQKSQKQQQLARDVTTMTTTTPVEAFMPRKYQEEIFIRAQSSNIIAALDTGSGKTYIVKERVVFGHTVVNSWQSEA
ncbi:hypothetical protein EDC04DRAFT_2896432 [Pisolithus marmoratus]|nr:hypothetical protein EDC04DRAFT_2896432 [Pisolithus marmoratus]